MLAFTIDCQWGYQDEQLQKHVNKCSQCSEYQNGSKTISLCYKGRDLCHNKGINLSKFLEYMLFAPTILAGPPLSYNSFCSFDTCPNRSKAPYLRTLGLLIFF